MERKKMKGRKTKENRDKKRKGKKQKVRQGNKRKYRRGMKGEKMKGRKRKERKKGKKKRRRKRKRKKGFLSFFYFSTFPSFSDSIGFQLEETSFSDGPSFEQNPTKSFNGFQHRIIRQLR
jgi:hypothetical protein